MPGLEDRPLDPLETRRPPQVVGGVAISLAECPRRVIALALRVREESVQLAHDVVDPRAAEKIVHTAERRELRAFEVELEKRDPVKAIAAGVLVESHRRRTLDRPAVKTHARRTPRKEALALGIDRHLELDFARACGERDPIGAYVRRAVDAHVLSERRERPGNGLEGVDLTRRADASRREKREVTDVSAAVDDAIAGSQQIRLDPGDIAFVPALRSHRSLQRIAEVESQREAIAHRVDVDHAAKSIL